VPTNTPAPTNTPLPTQAATPTQPPALTNTPAPAGTTAITPTVVSGSAIAHVNENTNCRSGPSTDYPVIVEILAGTDVKIVSKTTLDNYLVVEDPSDPTQTCWLYTQYVTTSGDLSSLPVATPPPPLLSFTFDFTKLNYCGGYSLEFEVINTGPKTLQAYTIVAKDLTEHTQQTTSYTAFDQLDGCLIAKAIGYVDTGKNGYVYANDFSYDPTGHSMEADITICSHNDMTGVCASQVIRFTP